ncbi:hypothetical protein VO56_00735 [Mycoplasmopsis gallinacea]|uniref:Extracellular matrix-binding protein ebh GA module domain-containing protein n=1 Tax=Mycoplasmopsis gallinacea TaxID=29556 RepID=A0A0D5ZIP1_9BACT|nr:hypothetical protein VO56_00735 [Mycoplasmopsis gallinacea]
MKERIRKIAKKSKRSIIFGSSSLIFAPLAIISTTPSDSNAETNQFDPNDWTYNNRFNMFSNVERFGYQGIQSRNQTTEGWKNTSIDDTNRYVKMENTFSIDTDSTVNDSSDNIYNFRSDREKVKVTFGETDNIVNGVIGFALSPDIDIVNGTMKYKVSVINTTDNTVESTEEITIANDLLVSKNQGTYFNGSNANQRRNLLSSTSNVQLSHFWVRRNYVVEGDGGENAGGFLHNRFLINNHEATTIANTYGVLYLNRMRQQPDYGEFGGSTGSMFTTYVTNSLPQGKRLKIEAEFETFKRQNPDLNFNNDNKNWNQTSYWKYSRFQTHIMAAYRMTSAPAGTMSVFGQFVRAERPKYMRIETGVKFNTDVLEERQYTGSNKLPNYTMPDTVLKIYQTVNDEKKLIATKDFTNISGRESAGDAASTKNGTLIDALYFDYDFNSFNRKVSAGEISYEFTLKNESDARFFKVNPGSIKFNGIWWTDNWREYQDYRLRSNTLTSTSGDFALDKFGISLSDDELKRNQIRDNLADKTNLSDAQKAAYEQWIAAQENLTDTQVEEANENVDSLDAAQENAFINIDNLRNLTNEEKQALKDQILSKTDFLPTGTISDGATVPTAKSGTFVNPRLDEILDLATAKNEIKNPNSNIASEELTPVNEGEEGYEEYEAKKDLNDLKEQARISLDNKLNELQSQIDTLDNANNATSTNNNLEKQIQNEEAKLAALNNLFDADRYNDLTLEQKQDFVNRINALDPSQDQDAFNEALESIKTDINRQEAIHDLGKLKDLNDAQKQAALTAINNPDATSDEIAAALENATNQNEKMTALKELVKTQLNALSSGDDASTYEDAIAQNKDEKAYEFATAATKTAYDTDLTNATSAATNNGENLSPEQIQALIYSLTNSYETLTNESTQKREDIADRIAALNNLSEAQREALTNSINENTNLEDALDQLEKAEALNSAIADLKQAISHAEDKKQESIYSNDSSEKQTALDNALEAAKAKLAEIQADTNMSSDNLESLSNDITPNDDNSTDNTIEALTKADEALDGNRQALRDKVDALSDNFSEEDKEALKEQIGALSENPTEEEINNFYEGLKQAATQKAKDAIDALENLSDGEKTAYKAQIDKAAENLYLANSETSPIDKALSDVVANAKGQDQERQDALDAIDDLASLSEAQKAAFKNNVKNATTPEEIQAELNKAKDYNALDTATGLAAKRAERAKESDDYKFADPEKQKAYNDALEALQDAIGDDATNTDPEVLKTLNKALNEAKAALNGDENLEAIKNNIDALENLSDAQKQAMKDKVDTSSSLEDAQNIEEQATNLDEAISSLKDAIDAAKSRTGDENANPAIPADSIYTLDDPARKEAVDNALAEAEAKLAQLQNLDLSDENTNIDSAVEAADSDSTILNDTIEALDGNRHALKQEVADKFGTLSPEALAIAKNDVNDLDREFTEEDKQNLLNNIFADAQVEAKNVIDNIEGLSPAEVKAFKDAIDAATINNAEGENFDKDLADILEQAKNAKALKDAAIAKINALENLNDAQKQALKNSVLDSPATDAVAISEKAAALDEAMKAYKDETFADNPISKTDNDYVLADENNKTAFDNALENRDELFGQNGANLNLETVKAAHEALKSAREALNGDEKLQAAKDAAIAKINGDNPEYASLTDAQKQAAIDAINAANNLDEVSAADAANSAANAATKRLKDYINNADTVKGQELYTGSEENLRNAYDQSIEDAKAALAKLENPDTENLLDVTVPKTASDDVHSAVAALNGDTNIAQEKQAAIDAINALENLNDAQKAALIEQVDSAIHPEDVRGIKAKAETLDTKMGELKAALEANANVKQSIDYLNSDNTNENPLKNNYDQALNNADLMADAENGGAQLDEAEVQKLIDALNNAKDALNGQEKFDEAKNEAIAAIDALENLNDAQKAAAKAALENKNLIADLEDIASDAKTLDTAMNQLKDSLDAYNAELENNPNYTEASEEPKQAYDDANNAATNATDKASGTALDLASVVALQKQLSDAKNNLDGHQNFLDKKAALIEEIQNDPNLNQNQKDELVKATKAAETSDNLNNVQDNKDQLSEAMAELRKVQEKAKDLLDKPVYANSSEEAQNALNDAITNNEPALDADEPVAYDLAKIQELIQATNNAIDNLDGNDRLDAKKQEAKDAIDALENLNDAQKAALKEDIDNSELISDIDDILDNASEFNDTMGDLINYNDNRLGDAYKDKTSRNYLDADKELKDAYDAALEAFNNALNNENSNIADSEALSKLLDDLKAAKAALNGEAKRKMAAEELAKLLAESDSVKAQDLYVKNSDEKQNAYDLAIAEGTFDYRDRDNLSLEEIKAAAQQIKDAKEALKDNLDALKGLIDNLENLNDAEKAAFKAEIDKYDNYQDRIAAYDKALALDKAKADLNSYIDSLNNLSDADKALFKEKLANEDFSTPGAIENFKDKITNANDLLEKLTNPDLNKDLSNEDLDNIKNALSNLELNDDSYAKLADALKVRNDINDALEAFRNSDYGSENYAANKDKLNDLIAKTVEFSSDNAAVQNAISNLEEDLDKHQMAAEAEMGIVDSILNGDKEEFERCMVMLDESNSPLYDKLSEALATSGFFENSNNNFKGLTKEQITILKNLSLGNVSHVIRSAYDQALKGATNNGIFRWWLLLSLALLTLGFWAFMLGRKRNKDL